MSEPILATYASLYTARDVVEDLLDAGLSREDIGLALYDGDGQYVAYMETEDVAPEQGAGFGALFGLLTGAGLGLAAITLPGVGPVVVAGRLAAVLGAAVGAGVGAAAGAVTGGLTAALVNMGIPEPDALYMASSLERGDALVVVTASGEQAEWAREILLLHNPVDWDYPGPGEEFPGWPDDEEKDDDFDEYYDDDDTDEYYDDEEYFDDEYEEDYEEEEDLVDYPSRPVHRY